MAFVQQRGVSCLGGRRAASMLLRNKKRDCGQNDAGRSGISDLPEGNQVMMMSRWQEGKEEIFYPRVSGLQLRRGKWSHDD